MGDPTEVLEPLASVYQTLEIPDLLKLNLTLDFGQNGLFEFMSSPKVLNMKAEYLGELLGELGVELETSMESVDAFLKTSTNVHLKVPFISDETATLKVTSDILEDLSTTSVYKLTTFPDVGALSDNVFGGSIVAESCGEDSMDLMTTLIFSSEDDSMKRICYDITAELPNGKGTLKQNIRL